MKKALRNFIKIFTGKTHPSLKKHIRDFFNRRGKWQFSCFLSKEETNSEVRGETHDNITSTHQNTMKKGTNLVKDTTKLVKKTLLMYIKQYEGYL